MDACREELLQSFSNRFTGLSFDILWVGYLDPRQTDMLHLKDNEKMAAKAHSITQVSNLIKESELCEVVRSVESSDSDSENDLNMFSIFGSSKRQKVSHANGTERDKANDALRCAKMKFRAIY